MTQYKLLTAGKNWRGPLKKLHSSVTKDTVGIARQSHWKRDYGLARLNELGGNVGDTGRSPFEVPNGTYSPQRGRGYAKFKYPHITAQFESADHCSDTGHEFRSGIQLL